MPEAQDGAQARFARLGGGGLAVRRGRHRVRRERSRRHQGGRGGGGFQRGRRCRQHRRAAARHLAACSPSTAIASKQNHDWLASKGAIPIAYGPDLRDELRAYQLDAFIDLHGPDYLDLAVELGVAPSRINTIISFAKAAQIGARTEGSTEGTSREVLSLLAELAAKGELELPIAATFPLASVRAAFELVEARHSHGKVVLLPEASGQNAPVRPQDLKAKLDGEGRTDAQCPLRVRESC